MVTSRREPLSTEPYKGVRDLYPYDMQVQSFIFEIMRRTVMQYGYAEYGASLLEPTELYLAKTSEEIVTEQTYSFRDRGDREVTLRPEMTPTVARMIAARKRELAFPLRWFSIVNVFRYERPQRGRLREHWQLNVDIFGSSRADADEEVLVLTHRLMTAFGAADSDFTIYLNSRKLYLALMQAYGLSDTETRAFQGIRDRREKISDEQFKREALSLTGNKLTVADIESLGKASLDFFLNHANDNVRRAAEEIANLAKKLAERGVSVRFDFDLERGFDYYTGIVFEVFDTNPMNKRSIFGGGRYDNLLDIFDAGEMPAVGFGLGDVTLRDFLETHNLLPPPKPSADLYLCRPDSEKSDYVHALAAKMRELGLRVAVDLSGKSIGDQIKFADKHGVRHIAVIGTVELKKGSFTVRELVSGTETTIPESNLDQILEIVKQAQ
ncbi:MAG: histidine--tRNA ligase [bacterium]|nr:histidine--tRNA ligase [bacterium]